MKRLKQKPGKAKVMEDGSIILVCDKGLRVFGYPMLVAGIFICFLLACSEIKDISKKVIVVFVIAIPLICILLVIAGIDIYKTAIMSREGVNIKIGRYEQLFRWHELKEKTMEIVKDHENYTLALFSLKAASNRPKWVTPIDFCHYRPFTSFYIILDYDWDFQQRGEWEGKRFYFSEPVFLEKMEEWNIELKKVKVVYSQGTLKQFR